MNWSLSGSDEPGESAASFCGADPSSPLVLAARTTRRSFWSRSVLAARSSRLGLLGGGGQNAAQRGEELALSLTECQRRPNVSVSTLQVRVLEPGGTGTRDDGAARA